MLTPQGTKLLTYLAIVLGFLIGFLYGSSKDPNEGISPLAPEFQTSSLQSIRGLRIDESVVKSEQFKALRIFGSMPVVPPQAGRSNPFQ